MENFYNQSFWNKFQINSNEKKIYSNKKNKNFFDKN